jgi:hypothetical protein
VSATLAFCTGGGRRMTRRGQPRTGSVGGAQTWEVCAEGGAWMGTAPAVEPLSRDPSGSLEVPRLRLTLRTECEGAPKCASPGHLKGCAVDVWGGTEWEALAMTGAHGPAYQAKALRAAANRLLRIAREREAEAARQPHLNRPNPSPTSPKEARSP